MRLRRLVLSAIVLGNAKGKRLAIRLTRWTGKSSEYVHPKHLLGEDDVQYWYMAHVRPGDQVLDVGCGNGLHTLKAAGRSGGATGIDRSLDSLAVGHRTAATAGRRLHLVCGDVERPLPFRSARFDRVICSDLLEHVYARDLVLREIRRVLRPDGLLLLSVPNRATSWKRRLERAGMFSYSDPDHKIEYTLAELEAELGRNGFAIVRLHPSVYDAPWVGFTDIAGALSLSFYRRVSHWRRRLVERRPEENAGFYAVCEPR